jgi:sphingomyelin phosphodiesterase acid-like 3
MRHGSTMRAAALALALTLTLALGLTPGGAALADDFVALSDVHLDPFTGTGADARLLAADVAQWPRLLADGGTAVAPYGRDANVALLDAVLADAARRVPAPDFVVYGGDAVVHDLARKVRAVDPAATDGAVAAAAAKITAYLAGRIGATFPGTPVLFALGNNDAGCGDYALEPGGDYLARTFPVVRALVGADRLEPDAEATFRAGGYYAARHPTLDGTVVVVLNTVLWSPKYRRCGAGAGAGPDDAPGDAMLGWLDARLAAAAAAGERVWLVYHVPTGVDAYATAHAAPAACAAQTVALWRAPYAAAFAALVTRHAGTVAAAFSGHIHRDSWRLFGGTGADGPAGFESNVPAVSPVYGDAPAYQVFGYDRATGALAEKTTYAVTNLDAAAAGAEAVALDRLYAFTAAYGTAPYGTAAVAGVAAALARDAPSPERTIYARVYGSGHGADPATDWPVYGCVPGAATAEAFAACRCAAD